MSPPKEPGERGRGREPPQEAEASWPLSRAERAAGAPIPRPSSSPPPRGSAARKPDLVCLQRKVWMGSGTPRPLSCSGPSELFLFTMAPLAGRASRLLAHRCLSGPVRPGPTRRWLASGAAGAKWLQRQRQSRAAWAGEAAAETFQHLLLWTATSEAAAPRAARAGEASGTGDSAPRGLDSDLRDAAAQRWTRRASIPAQERSLANPRRPLRPRSLAH